MLIDLDIQQVISIHTPARGVTLRASRPMGGGRISIHTPARGVTSRTKFILEQSWGFRSTPPRGG